MKKNVIVCAVVAITAVCFYSCVSSTPVASSTTTVEEFDYRIVDSKAKSTGMNVGLVDKYSLGEGVAFW